MRQTLIRRFLFSNLIRSNENKIVSSAATATVPAASTGDRFMRKIDLEKDMHKLSPEQKIYIQKLIEKNNLRYAEQKKLRRHYKITGVTLFAFVFSIYFYTMYKIQQEKFLDDFTVPEPPDPAVKAFANRK